VQTFFFGRGASVVREQNAVRNDLGHPLGSFYGLVAEGYYVDSAGCGAVLGTGRPSGSHQIPRSERRRPDHRGDRTLSGARIPSSPAGSISRCGAVTGSLSSTVFGSFGGKIFNTQRYWYAFPVLPDERGQGHADQFGRSWTAPARRSRRRRRDIAAQGG